MAAVSLHRARLDDAEFRRFQEEYGAALSLLYAQVWECRRGKPAPLRCGRKQRSHTAPAELADRVAARFDVGRSEAQAYVRLSPYPMTKVGTFPYCPTLHDV